MYRMEGEVKLTILCVMAVLLLADIRAKVAAFCEGDTECTAKMEAP